MTVEYRFRCNVCQAVNDYIDISNNLRLPKEWYRVENSTGVVYHYCSIECFAGKETLDYKGPVLKLYNP